MKLFRLALVVTVATVFVCAASVTQAVGSPTPNAFGIKYVGSQQCLSCHGSLTGRWQVGTYVQTSHGLNVRSVAELGGVGGITPSASSSYWPSPIFGTGTFRFAPADAWLQMGSPNAGTRRFVSFFKNDGPHTLSTGDTLPTTAGPSDDLILFNGRFYTDDPHWYPSAINSRLVFQNCGPCHFTGVTRPSNVTFTLPNGSSITPSTESTMTAYGIHCESCHASSESGSDTHWNNGIALTRTLRALKSQTCAQCHAVFSSKELNYTKGRFSNPSGFTPDQDLRDFGTLRGSEYVQQNAEVPAPSIPTTDTYFYPSGHRKSGGHGAPIFNEYQLSGHARSMRNPDGSLAIPELEDDCLPCHSGEAFLQSLDYGKRSINDVSLHESSVASDTLNIECAVCHTVHAQGDKPMGLRVEGDGLCVRCHIKGTAQIRSGEGLIGVGTLREWMPDAECASCHMPEMDGMRSHRFAIMMPGDAARWNVAEGSDSCSPCHGGSTRADLQQSIDEWQSTIHDGLADARGGVSGAKARAAASSVQGAALLKDAETNLELVERDGSFGVHNYPYAKAGLEKAAYFAKAVGSGFTRFGSTGYNGSMKMAMVYGTLEFGDGEAAAGEKIAIWAKPAESTAWAMIGTATTGDDGDFGYYVGPAGTTSYKAVWAVKRDVDVTSAATTVKLGSTTNASVSAGSIALRRYVKISGSVSPSHSGGRLTIQYKRGSGAWKTLSARTLNGGSAYSYGWRPTARGTYYVKSVFAGDAGHTGSTSSTRRVVVR